MTLRSRVSISDLGRWFPVFAPRARVQQSVHLGRCLKCRAVVVRLDCGFSFNESGHRAARPVSQRAAKLLPIVAALLVVAVFAAFAMRFVLHSSSRSQVGKGNAVIFSVAAPAPQPRIAAVEATFSVPLSVSSQPTVVPPSKRVPVAPRIRQAGTVRQKQRKALAPPVVAVQGPPADGRIAQARLADGRYISTEL